MPKEKDLIVSCDADACFMHDRYGQKIIESMTKYRAKNNEHPPFYNLGTVLDEYEGRSEPLIFTENMEIVEFFYSLQIKNNYKKIIFLSNSLRQDPQREIINSHKFQTPLFIEELPKFVLAFQKYLKEKNIDVEVVYFPVLFSDIIHEEKKAGSMLNTLQEHISDFSHKFDRKSDCSNLLSSFKKDTQYGYTLLDCSKLLFILFQILLVTQANSKNETNYAADYYLIDDNPFILTKSFRFFSDKNFINTYFLQKNLTLNLLPYGDIFKTGNPTLLGSAINVIDSTYQAIVGTGPVIQVPESKILEEFEIFMKQLKHLDEDNTNTIHAIDQWHEVGIYYQTMITKLTKLPKKPSVTSFSFIATSTSNEENESNLLNTEVSASPR